MWSNQDAVTMEQKRLHLGINDVTSTYKELYGHGRSAVHMEIITNTFLLRCYNVKEGLSGTSLRSCYVNADVISTTTLCFCCDRDTPVPHWITSFLTLLQQVHWIFITPREECKILDSVRIPLLCLSVESWPSGSWCYHVKLFSAIGSCLGLPLPFPGWLLFERCDMLLFR
jgi:hypothetical protein